MDIISSNPYRLLGVYSNSPIKDRIANANKLKAYLKVGKSVDFPLDLSNLIPAPIRTVESMEHANACINLPHDQLKYALFWFIKVSSIDEMALGYLQNGNTDKAKELLEKKETFSSLINLGVLALIQKDKAVAIQTITKVIHNDDYRAAFVKAVCDETCQISEDELARLFMDELLAEIPTQELMQLFLDNGTTERDNSYLKEKAVGEPIAAINAEIAKAKSVKNNDADAQYDAGVSLMNNTKGLLDIVKTHLGTKDMQYQMVADNLAKQILQCGINYYNNSYEPHAALKAMPIQRYALLIAVGAIVKDRCTENVNTLQKIIENLPPLDILQEDYQIKQSLERFRRAKEKWKLISQFRLSPFISTFEATENDLDFVITLLRETKIDLDRIKKVIVSHDYYWKMTDLVVNCALSEVIEYVNSINNDSLKCLPKEQTFKKVRTIIHNSMRVMSILKTFDMSPKFKTERYNPNKNVLKEMEKQINISISNQSKNSGCIVWIVIAIVGSIIVSYI